MYGIMCGISYECADLYFVSGRYLKLTGEKIEVGEDQLNVKG